jgi:hypothetical protein
MDDWVMEISNCWCSREKVRNVGAKRLGVACRLRFGDGGGEFPNFNIRAITAITFTL